MRPALAADHRVAGLSPTASLSALASAAVVGRAYLQIRPLEADRDVLEATLWHAFHEAAPVPTEGIWSRRAIGLAARAAVARDFAMDQVVTVDGWVLAETEARICALAAFETASS